MRVFAAVVLLSCLCACAPGSPDLPPWVEEHDLTGPALDASAQTKRADGYRPISISVYGASANPRYAVVWVKRAGPQWELLRGMSLGDLGVAFVGRISTGALRSLSATDDGTPTFAGIWEQGGEGVGQQRLVFARSAQAASSGDTTIEAVLGQARRPANGKQKLLADRETEERVAALAVYGTSFDPRFVVILQPNPERRLWNADAYAPGLYGMTNTSSLDAHAITQHRTGLLPTSFAVLADSRTVRTVFNEDPGGGWALQHDLDGTQLAAAVAQQRGLGRLPVSLQGASRKPGAPDATFVVVFAETDLPAKRAFSVDGLPASTPQTDAVMKKFMEANGVTQAAVAVLKDLHLVAVRQYTNAAPALPATTRKTVWRLASMTKVLTAIAIEQLVDEGKLVLSRPAQDVLQWKKRDGSAPADPNFASITVQQLLWHLSGIPEWTPTPRDVVNGGVKLATPGHVTQDDYVEFLMTRTITNHPPGAVGCQDTDGAAIHCFQYSNVGYFILARIVEKVRGKPFLDAIGDTMFAPLAAQRPRWSEPSITDQPQDEARYIDGWQSLALTQLDTNGTAYVPVPYGGDFTKIYDGAGSLSVHPAAYLKLMASLNATSTSARSPGIVPVLSAAGVQDLLANHDGFDFTQPMSGDSTRYTGVKGGYLSGLQSSLNYAQNRMSYVVFFNRNELSFGVDTWWPSFPELETAMQAELGNSTDDFFAQF